MTNSGSIAATAPMASAGTVDVRVTVNGVTSAVNEPGDEFTYKVPTTGTITAVGTLASVEGIGHEHPGGVAQDGGRRARGLRPDQRGGLHGVVGLRRRGGHLDQGPELRGVGGRRRGDLVRQGHHHRVRHRQLQLVELHHRARGRVRGGGVQRRAGGLHGRATDKTGTLNNASSTTVAMPSLTPAGTGELYFGYSAVAGTAVAGTTSGVTYAVTAEANVAAYDPGVSGALSPAPTQSPAGTSSSVGVLLSVSLGPRRRLRRSRR